MMRFQMIEGSLFDEVSNHTNAHLELPRSATVRADDVMTDTCVERRSRHPIGKSELVYYSHSWNFIRLTCLL